MGWLLNRSPASDDFMQMKTIYQAICLFIFFVSSAFADYTPSVKYLSLNTYGAVYYSSKQELCLGVMPKFGQTYYSADPLTSVVACTDSTTQTQQTSTSGMYSILAIYKRTSGSNSSTADTGFAIQDCSPNTRKSGYPPNVICNGTAPPQCTVGDAGFSGIPQPSGSSASTLSPSSINQIGCKNGCLTKLDASRGNWYGGSDGSSYNVYGYSNYTGATCSVSSSNPAPSNAPPAPNIKDCADSGKSYGTVNGVAVCVSAGSTGSAPVIQNKTGASSTSTPAPTPENPNPTPVTTKEPDSMVISVPPSATSDGTVKTGQTNADGSQTSTSESKESFCSKNPASEQCQAKSLCEKNPDAPSCKDICEKKPDLLICKQTDIDQLCADKPDRWECKKAEDLIGKKDDLPNEELGKKSVNVGDNFNFNPVNIQSNATCPPPLTTAIAGATITVSFDWLCAYASAFRPLVMALAFFFAYGIIAAAIRADAQPYQRGLF